MNRERSTCLFDRITENGKNGRHDDHGGDNKRMRSREIQAAGGRKKSDDGGIMFFSFSSCSRNMTRNRAVMTNPSPSVLK
jgi:hypothetical protein